MESLLTELSPDGRVYLGLVDILFKKSPVLDRQHLCRKGLCFCNDNSGKFSVYF